MIAARSFQGKRVALFGLGISGLSAAHSLRAGGAIPVVWDDTAERRSVALEQGFEVENLLDADWGSFTALVLSPGVPLTHPEPHWSVLKAQAANVPVIGDTELFFLEFLERGGSDKVIAITGTNGKSTTTALTTHILKSAHISAVMGGNIGYGVLDLPDFGAGTVYVLELSSYQIDLTPTLRPSVAGLLNISPDHIDRHGSVEHYAEVKSMIFDQLDHEGRAVISLDDDYCKSIAAELETEADVCFVASQGDLPQGARLLNRGFVLFQDGLQAEEIDLSLASALRGRHNSQNAAFAYLLASKVVARPDELLSGFASFPGLAHRCQEIARFTDEGGQTLLFVNDSKATNAEASATALSSFDQIYWIAGGRAKEGGIEMLTHHFDAIQHAYLIGEAADDFSQTLKNKNVAFEVSGDIEKAVRSAFERARDEVNGEAAILLSPAAASFDQYPNFEVRGEAFSRAVNNVISGLEGAVVRQP